MATIDLGKIKFNWRNQYDASTAYVPDDCVYYADGAVTSSYICKTASTGNAPSSGGTLHASWDYLALGQAPIPTTTQGDIVVRGASTNERLAIGSAGQALKVNSAGNGLEYGPGGGVIQTKQATFTGTQQIGQNFADISALSVTITVGSTAGVANKVLLTPSIVGSNAGYGGFRMTRTTGGTTTVVECRGAASGNRQRVFAWFENYTSHSLRHVGASFIDNPGAGTHTYKVQAGSPYDSSYYVNINYTYSDDNYSYTGRGISMLTVQEVLP